MIITIFPNANDAVCQQFSALIQNRSSTPTNYGELRFKHSFFGLCWWKTCRTGSMKPGVNTLCSVQLCCARILLGWNKDPQLKRCSPTKQRCTAAHQIILSHHEENKNVLCFLMLPRLFKNKCRHVKFIQNVNFDCRKCFYLLEIFKEFNKSESVFIFICIGSDTNSSQQRSVCLCVFVLTASPAGYAVMCVWLGKGWTALGNACRA